MCKICLLAMAIVSLSCADVTSGEKERLYGEWVVQSFVYSGKEMDNVKGSKFVFKSDQVVMNMLGGEHACAYSIDSTKSPKQLDFITGEKNDPSGSQMRAIYKFQGQKLILCISVNYGGSEGETLPDKIGPRPTRFDSKEGALVTVTRRMN